MSWKRRIYNGSYLNPITQFAVFSSIINPILDLKDVVFFSLVL